MKKLIEVALPLEAINAASAREKSIRHGHPSTLHLWWARRPLAAARAVIFAQLVDDPSTHPERFPTEAAQEQERQRLFQLIGELVKWENSTNEGLLAEARQEIWQSWRDTCAANRNHPRAAELFDPERLPAFHDPFAGGGALPLEAQRLGLEAYASDLNPVAVLINKAMIEIPPKFSGRSPINPVARHNPTLFARQWQGAEGLAEDVRYYGQWMRDQAQQRIGHLYPKITVTAEMVKERPDLRPYEGQSLTVIAWLWARTVKSPNPAFNQIDVPLASTFMLSTKAGKEAYVRPELAPNGYRFTVRVGKPEDEAAAKSGTKLARGANFKCLMSNVVINDPYIKAESMAGRMGTRLMAIVAEGQNGRIYLSPTPEQEAIARQANPAWKPDLPMNRDTSNLVSGRGYGFFTWADLFTPRQLTALTTFSDLVAEAIEQAKADALAHHPADDTPLHAGGTGPTAYAQAIGIYLAFALDKGANYWSSLCSWHTGRETVTSTFGRQALPMVWDYTEANPFSHSSGNFGAGVEQATRLLETLTTTFSNCVVKQSDATNQIISFEKVVSTDPPYYDNIGYADLSDFFYVWLRHSLETIFPDLFTTLAVPKIEELVATPYRHGTKEKAEKFFLDGMTQAMNRLAVQIHPAFPATIYYAFKQQETDNPKPEPTTAGISSYALVSTGWETFLDAVIRSGFIITGTWPVRTEYTGNLKKNLAALASSIVLVCRPRPANAPLASSRDFRVALKRELPAALRLLQSGNIAPVDLAQSAIGPGMAIYSRYRQVTEGSGRVIPVGEALALINQVLDEVLAEQEGDFDPDSRWALAWFEEFGFNEGEYGRAETLSKAKNTSVAGLEGIVTAKRGKVQLIRPEALPANWDPTKDNRLTAWEIVHHLIRLFTTGGETAAASLMQALGGRSDIARELAYRLYTISERKKRTDEAYTYNALVESWFDISHLAQLQQQEQPQLHQTSFQL